MTDEYCRSGVSESFRPGCLSRTFPEYGDREGWKAFSRSTYSKNVVAAAEKLLGWEWKTVPASAFISVRETGEYTDKRIETENRNALLLLATAEAVEGKGRFMKDLADGFWFYASSYSWTLVNKTGEDIIPTFDKETVALGSGRTGQALSVIWSIFGREFDSIDPMIGEAFRENVRRLILDPFLDPRNDAEHWWLGNPHTRRLNNHTPWNVESVFACAFAAETDPARLDAILKKGLAALDVYLDDFPDDGLCDEGPTYWFASAGKFCELLLLLKEASGGSFDVMPDPFISSLGSYISRCCAGQTQKGKEIVANYGDAEPFVSFNPFVIWRASDVLDLEELRELAVYTLWNGREFKMPKPSETEAMRAFRNLLCAPGLESSAKSLKAQLEAGADPNAVLESLRRRVPVATWYPDGGILFARTSSGWFFSGKAAHNGEAHNHNDAGSCILYADGIPVLIDPGVGRYTVQTFGPDRYKIWTMVSDWHNVPVINGTAQRNGEEFRTADVSYSGKRRSHTLSMDIHGAYPAESRCLEWRREYFLLDGRGGSALKVRDRFRHETRKGSDVEHFIVCGQVVPLSAGKLLIRTGGRDFEMSWPADALTLSVDARTDLDRTLKGIWGGKISRISLTSSADAPLSGEYVMEIKAIN